MSAPAKIFYGTPSNQQAPDTSPITIHYSQTFTGLTVGKRYRASILASNVAVTPGSPRAITLSQGDSSGSVSAFHTAVPNDSQLQQEHDFIATHPVLKVEYQSNDAYHAHDVIAINSIVFLI